MNDVQDIQKISLCFEAAQIHKKVRKDLKNYLDEDRSLKDICFFIEDQIKMYSNNQLNNGIAFPAGLCLNNMAAHWTPSQKALRILDRMIF